MDLSHSVAKSTAKMEEQPPILVLGPPLTFNLLESKVSHIYHFLKAFSSKLSLPQFLQSQHIHPSSIQVIFCNPHQPVTADVIRLLPSLRLVITSSAGTDHIDIHECSRRGIQVVSCAPECSDDVADVAVGLLIDVMCKISAGDRYVRKLGSSAKPWSIPFGSKLGGKRVGIIGLGKIGGAVAKRLETFGCIIMYHSRNKKPSITYTFYSDVIDLASNSDILVLCCPLTEHTKHMINKEVILALGKEGIIVNVGRGALIDEKELVQCLVKGEIKGAGLDVFEHEPNVPKELITLDNVVLSPHAASLTLDGFVGTCELVEERLNAFFTSRSQ